MNTVSMVLLCVASNIDNLSAAVTLGLRSITVPLPQNAVIAAVTVLGTYVSMGAGTLLADHVAQAADVIGAVAIMAIGAWTILQSWPASTSVAVTEAPGTTIVRVRSHLSLRASVALAAALAINNVATGVGAGATGLSPLWTALLSGAVSLVFVACGDRLASGLAGVLSPRRSALLAGLLLIVLGVYELVV